MLAEAEGAANTAIAPVVERFVTRRADYDDALCHLMLFSLSHDYTRLIDLHCLVRTALLSNPSISLCGLEDLQVFRDRDAACRGMLEAFLLYKGFRVLQAYRVAHHYWQIGQRDVARLLQSVISDKFAMDIHPAAKLAGGIFIDHGTGITIGETAVVKRNVSILHDVTLGGTGKESAQRHPNIEEGVLIGAGAKILGNITVGKNAKVAAGSIVLHHVPENVTVVGIPARVIARHLGKIPAYDMG
jgi:serine O-acetyltransferase